MDYEEALMAKIAWMYYFEDLTQQQIAERMDTNRARIVKLLEKARKTGLIRFNLRRGSESRMETEKKLMERYGLQDAFIVPAPSDETMTNENVAKAASMYILERLHPGSTINIGYGDTPCRVLNRMATLTDETMTCVSLTGGVSYYLPDSRSNVFNAKLHLIPAPLLASNREMAEAILAENSIKEISRMISLAQLTVVGIGSMQEDATVFRTGILNANDLLYLRTRGAVGDILSHFIDKDGKLVNSPIEERLISTSLEVLHSLKNVIGVAAGEKKADAIRGVLAGNTLNVLITDEPTAIRILNETPESE